MQKTIGYMGYLLALILVGSCSLSAYAAESAAPEAPDTKKQSDESGDTSKPPEKGKEAEGGKSKKPTDVTGGRFAGDPIYIRLPPLVLPILGDTGPEQLVTVQITVEVKDFDTGDSIQANMPKVMDALLRALYGGLTEGSLRNGRLVNIAKVKAKATAALQAIEGADNIKDVLIVNMAQRTL